METSNPALRDSSFRAAALDRSSADVGTMTMSGAINKAGILLLLLVGSATFAWNYPNPLFMMAGAIGGLICAMILIFKPVWAPTLAPAYAVLEGLLLGTISLMFDQSYPGVPVNAMCLTFATLGIMLFVYRMGWLRATPMFQRAVVFATGAIAITYVVDMMMGFFGSGVPMIHQSTPAGIAFSVITVGVAAFNLIIDFAMFENQAAGRSPKYMEWYCGFALLVTLVWLYMEMLRLMSKLNRR